MPFDSFYVEIHSRKSIASGIDVDNPYEVDEKKPLRWEDIQEELPTQRSCKLCGSQLLFYCPPWSTGFFCIPDPVFCTYCGNKIKRK